MPENAFAELFSCTKPWSTALAAALTTCTLATGVAVPMPSRLAELSQKNLVPSELNPPAPSLNCTEPATPDELEPPVAAMVMLEPEGVIVMLDPATSVKAPVKAFKDDTPEVGFIPE